MSDLELETERCNKRVKLSDDEWEDASDCILPNNCQVGVSEDIGPPSARIDWAPPFSITHQVDAIKHIVELAREAGDLNPDIVLNEFVIYSQCPRSQREKTDLDFPSWMRLMPLHELQASQKNDRDCYLFDGFISYKDVKFYLFREQFTTLTIDGYLDLEMSSIKGLWIQSKLCKHYKEYNNLYYRLCLPDASYSKWQQNFAWIADFTKHFIDFIDYHPEASLLDFRIKFSRWLKEIHGSAVMPWIVQYGREDFRVPVTSYVSFLWKETCGLGEKKLSHHSIWGEISNLQSLLTKIPKQPKETNWTMVTPFAKEIFDDIYFASALHDTPIEDNNTLLEREQKLKSLSFPPDGPLSTSKPQEARGKVDNELVWKIVAIKPDEDCDWRDKSPVWYAYVQGIREVTIKGELQVYLEVLWLYEPSQTPCGKSYYPYQNELFFSNHCNCKGLLPLKEVLYVLKNVKRLKPEERIPVDCFFYRQKYETKTHGFVTITQTDFHCTHLQPSKADEESLSKPKPGDCVLISTSEVTILEPAIVDELHSNYAVVRLFRRLSVYDSTASPNELVLTSEFKKILYRKIVRSCHVKLVLCGQKVPHLFDRNGQADLFYVSNYWDTNSMTLQPIKPITQDVQDKLFKDGLPDYLEYGTLGCISLFSGGGNFDRGLAEGGAITHKEYVECNSFAAHTLSANSNDDCTIFNGSVDDHFMKARRGFGTPIGEVLIICAGSPCQGFSIMQQDALSETSMRNASKIATLISYVDHFRPAYAIFENVPNICRELKDKEERSHNVFSQLICAIVAMGYQCRQFVLNSANFGSCQSRSRVFFCLTAPGLIPVDKPPITHYLENKRVTTLGRTAAGVEICDNRDIEPATFPFVNVEEAWRDLPDIGRGLLGNISYPEHRIVSSNNFWDMMRCQAVPSADMYPKGYQKKSTLSAAAHAGILNPFEYELWERSNKHQKAATSQAYRRVNRHGLLPTINTSSTISDAKAANPLHYHQLRPVSLMEAKRAQDIGDEEPIIGPDSQKWKIIGNAVARPVALALGFALQRAWVKNGETTCRRVLNGDASGSFKMVVR